MLHLTVLLNYLADRAAKVEVSEGHPYPLKSPSMDETNGEWKGGAKYYKVILYIKNWTETKFVTLLPDVASAHGGCGETVSVRA